MNSKRTQIKLIAIFFTVFLAIQLITYFAESLKMIEYAFLTIAVGFAPAYYFRKEFKFSDLVGWGLHAGVLGVLFIPMVFLFFGWLQLNFLFEYSIVFLYALAVIGLGSLFFQDELDICEYAKLGKITKFDWIILFFFGCYTAALTLINFHSITIIWDFFTYWGLDAKYIFDFNQLRGQQFHTDVIFFRYTSLYPIHLSLIYDLYGVVVEQFAAWFNVYLNLLAILLVYWRVKEKQVSHKFRIAASLLLISYAAKTSVNMLSLYADILTAFLLLVFFLILTNDTERKLNTYWQRAFLLSMIAVSYYFLKSPLLYFSIILVAVWLLYDFHYIRENWRELTRSWTVWGGLLVVGILLVMRMVYFHQIGGDSTQEQMVSNLPTGGSLSSLQSMWQYAVMLLDYLLAETPYLLGLWWLSLMSIFFVKIYDKKYWFIYFASVLIFLIPIAGYFFLQHALEDDSVQRYSAIVMYLFPWVFSYVQSVEKDDIETRGKFKLERLQALLSGGIFAIVICFVFIMSLYPMPVVERFNLSPGTYQSEMTKYDKYAKRVLGLTGEDARILIVDDNYGFPGITINRLPGLFVRYFLPYNSVGGFYSLPAEELPSLAAQSSADYLLLFSHENIFLYCDDMLSPTRDYLIDLSTGDFINEKDGCIFSDFDRMDLGDALH